MITTSDQTMWNALILLTILSLSDAEYQKGHWKSQEEVEADFEKRFAKSRRSDDRAAVR